MLIRRNYDSIFLNLRCLSSKQTNIVLPRCDAAILARYPITTPHHPLVGFKHCFLLKTLWHLPEIILPLTKFIVDPANQGVIRCVHGRNSSDQRPRAKNDSSNYGCALFYIFCRSFFLWRQRHYCVASPTKAGFIGGANSIGPPRQPRRLRSTHQPFKSKSTRR